MNPILDLLIKVSGLLILGWAFTSLLSKSSAAARHLAWLLTLCACLFAGVASRLLPSVPLRVLSAAATPVALTDQPAVDLPRELGQSRGPARSEVVAGLPQRPSTALSLETVLSLVWIGGALLLAFWYAVGQVGLARLARRATVISDPEWNALTTRLTERAGFPAPFRLLRTSRVGSPVTWGVRPVVLLPESATSWTSERRLVVLAHELAHAARGDYLARLIASVATVLFWFHPLVWIAARRLRLESERACDDQVLRAGVSGVDYAAHLLEVARGSRALRLGGAIAIGMARPSQLEGRLLAVLDEHQSRKVPRSRAQLAGWAAVLLLVPPFAALRPAPRLGKAVNTIDLPVELRDSSFTREVPAAPGGTLQVELEVGGTLIIRGWDDPTVRIQGHLDGADWRRTRVSVERTARGVSLRNWQERSVESSSTAHAFEIMVPRRFNLELKSAGGGVTLSGLEGTFRGETGGGNIVIEKVYGEADLSTGGGDVRVSDSELAGSVGTGGGEVQFRNVKGSLNGSSGSESELFRDREREEKKLRISRNKTEEVEREKRRKEEEKAVKEELKTRNELVREKAEAIERELRGKEEQKRVKELEERKESKEFLEREKELDKERKTEKAEGKLRINKAGGAISLPSAMGGATLTTGGGPIRVGASSGLVSASTGGGDITIAPAAGSVRAGTGAGDVEVEIVDEDGEAHVVDIRSGSGSATITLPRNFTGRFDLETAYTRSYGGPTRIEAPWTLERESTEDWDSSEGSPRKYVRARGRIGDGDGLIRVRIVNGNITIRRER